MLNLPNISYKTKQTQVTDKKTEGLSKLLQDAPQINCHQTAFCCLIVIMFAYFVSEAESLVIHAGFELAK